MSAQAVSSSRLELGSQHPCEVFEDRPFGELGSRKEQQVALGSGMGKVGNGRQETSEHILGVSHVNHFYLTQYNEASIIKGVVGGPPKRQRF